MPVEVLHRPARLPHPEPGTSVLFRKTKDMQLPDWNIIAAEASNSSLIDTVSQRLRTYLQALNRSQPNRQGELESLSPRDKDAIDGMPATFAMAELAKRISHGISTKSADEAKIKILNAEEVKKVNGLLTNVTPHTEELPEEWKHEFSNLLTETEITYWVIHGSSTENV